MLENRAQQGRRKNGEAACPRERRVRLRSGWGRTGPRAQLKLANERIR